METVAAAFTYKAQRDAGAMARIQYKEQAQQEQDAARSREIDRRRRLVEALASQNAEAGAIGAATGVGSRRAIAMADARLASLDSLTDRASTNRRAIMLRKAGDEAYRQARLQGYATLLDTAGDAAKSGSWG